LFRELKRRYGTEAAAETASARKTLSQEHEETGANRPADDRDANAGGSDSYSKTWKEHAEDLMEAIREALDPSRAKELIWGALTPTGQGYNLKTETLKKTEVIARGREIREVRELVRKFGGRPQDWIKWKGESQVASPSGVSRPAEIHWYEHHGIGQRKAKWVRWLD